MSNPLDSQGRRIHVGDKVDHEAGEPFTGGTVQKILDNIGVWEFVSVHWPKHDRAARVDDQSFAKSLTITEPNVVGESAGLPVPRKLVNLLPENVKFKALRKALQHAVDKHGWKKTPLSLGMTKGRFLAILVEEVGEVARAQTYDATGDGPSMEDERDECLQVAAMAYARYLALSSRLSD